MKRFDETLYNWGSLPPLPPPDYGPDCGSRNWVIIHTIFWAQTHWKPPTTAFSNDVSCAVASWGKWFRTDPSFEVGAVKSSNIALSAFHWRFFPFSYSTLPTTKTQETRLQDRPLLLTVYQRNLWTLKLNLHSACEKWQ